MELSQRLRLWSDELRVIANEGLHRDRDNPYGLRRFQRVLRIATELFAAQDTRDADAIERLYRGDIMHTAPYPCGGAAVFNAEPDLPPLSPGHATRIADAFRYWRGELSGTVFDRT